MKIPVTQNTLTKMNNIPPIINRHVAFAMTALCLYGILLIFIANKNITPYSFFTSFKFHNGLRLWNVEVSNSEISSSSVSTNRSVVNNTTVNGTKSTSPSSTVGMNNNSSKLPVRSTATPVKADAIITMFTTFRNSPAKEFIYKNTIRNWALLKPYVIPVLYHSKGDPSMNKFCSEHGWYYSEVPKVSQSGIPVLRHMFLDAQKDFDTPFYAYTNGDILFDMQFIETLKLLKSKISKLKKVLIVGRRSNMKLQTGHEINSLAEVTQLGKKAQLFGTNAEDYFISTKNGYPWETIPDFVVGRVGYDNWLVVTAITKGMPTIDTTKTVLALHQTGADGNYAGHKKKSTGDTYINYGLAGKRFDYSLGHVTCGQFYTDYASNKTILLKERVKNGCERTYKRYKKNPYIHLPTRRL